MGISIKMVNYYEKHSRFLDEVLLISVKSGKELNENGGKFKSTHHYYVITCNAKRWYFDTKEWFISL